MKFLETVSSTRLVAITLITGDIFLGEVLADRESNKNYIDIAFNTPDGKRYGRSQLLRLTTNQIASMIKVPLAEESIPKLGENDPEILWLKNFYTNDALPSKLPVHNYPNPLATIIYEHNMMLAQKYGLATNRYLIEESLAQDGIPIGGIFFDQDFLMFADWAFFHTQARGETNFAVSPIPGLITIEKSISQSLEQQIIQRLKANLAERIRQLVTSDLGEYRVLTGALLVPDPPQDETIEGEICHLYRIANDNDDLPVLIKVKQLKYPQGFLNRISSPMTCYGELLQLPVSIVGKHYSHTLLLRAMAYLS